MFKLAERVKETTATTGTGTLTLAGAVTSFQTFLSGIGNGSTCTFMTTDGTNWEVAEGALSGGTSLTRATIIASSNGGSAVSWSTGNKTVALVHPGDRQNELLIGKDTAAADSTLDFSVDGTYTRYRLEFDNLRLSADGASLLFRISIAAAFLAADYQYDITTNGNGSVGALNSTTATHVILAGATDNASASHAISGEISIITPNNGTYTKDLFGWGRYRRNADNLMQHNIISGKYIGAATAIDAIRILPDSGNIASGEVRLFGRKY